MFSIVDCNNFWSPSGGGVRRYHLEKMEFYKHRQDVKYSFVMHDRETWTEQIGENAFIEHLEVPKVYGNWEYRYLTRSAPLEPILRRLDPDVIEVGSPYFMPGIVRKIVRKHGLKARTYGFWHADFPVTYVKRFLEPLGSGLAGVGERMAWKYARKNYNQMDGVIVSSRLIMERMEKNGLENVHFLPLGVNEKLFHPERKDQRLISALKKGNEERLLLFFPHRFSKEKGLDVILEAYPLMCDGLDYEPVLIIAGMGPYEHLAREASERYEFVELRGFIEGKEEMARYYASADLGFALSKWETFGLSLLESLSSGLPLIAANEGAAFEHIDRSGAGTIIKEVTPEAVAGAVIQFSLMNARKMREKARAYAEQLTWESCFENQLAIYRG
ncbi:glycosyltransferase [Marinoscillum sp.]|uniref:glycosyltransferase n=1 Tax=Marinoscillum sp. TaxID=2024838 RepID=UPI003BAC504C